MLRILFRVFVFFFFNDTATTEIYTLSLHDALPICCATSSGSERLPAIMPSVCNDGVGTELNAGPGFVDHHRIERKRTRIVNLVDIHRCPRYRLFMIPTELVAAWTEPLILSLLSQGGESYGYALIQEVRKLSQEQMQWTDGMLYPVLHRMEDSGWIRSRGKDAGKGRKRKYYSIKRDGQRALGERRAQWTTVHSLLAGLWKEQYVCVGGGNRKAGRATGRG